VLVAPGVGDHFPVDQGLDCHFDRQAEFLALLDREPLAEGGIVCNKSDQNLAAGQEELHILIGRWRVFAIQLIDEGWARSGVWLKFIVLEHKNDLVETPENQMKGKIAVDWQLEPDIGFEGAFPVCDKAKFPLLEESKHLPSHAIELWLIDSDPSMRDLFIFAHALNERRPKTPPFGSKSGKINSFERDLPLAVRIASIDQWNHFHPDFEGPSHWDGLLESELMNSFLILNSSITVYPISHADHPDC
jgi:hypothetical protein